MESNDEDNYQRPSMICKCQKCLFMSFLLIYITKPLYVSLRLSVSISLSLPFFSQSLSLPLHLFPTPSPSLLPLFSSFFFFPTPPSFFFLLSILLLVLVGCETVSHRYPCQPASSRRTTYYSSWLCCLFIH